ncbi:YceI family protein [Streptomyces turgidiscabies]|uniref:Polyisoprenoid-binding protein YceI n=1 Tax=Streptomyces turgidiscabies TaxID=85558 RepID=A0ABU0RXI9_9ACTN|nr:YceI family protein [Streptomyces turgidiscabies]MDQ0936699.1 polyisoprenoid-binding protein YceI [Streptomyces turgidiscabies]
MALALLRRLRSKGVTDREGLSLALPPGAGALGCEVLDPLGQPMGGAEVTVSAAGVHQVMARGTTDPYGYFLAVLPTGSYRLMVSAEGLTPYRETVDLLDGVMLPTQRVRLEPARPLDLPVPGAWLFDPPHTAIRFIAKHVGMGHVHGRFERFEGGIQVARTMTDSRVQVRIDASSITTGNRTRDNHLRSADFLDVERYPHIDFVSSRFSYRAGAKWVVQGSLTMHGVSRSMSLDTTYLGSVNGGYGEELRCAALARAELHREDYTLNWRSMLARGIAVVGPTVQLELDVQAMYRTHGTPTPPE